MPDLHLAIRAFSDYNKFMSISGEEGESIIDEVILAAIPKAKLTKKQLKEIKSQKTAEDIKIALSKAADGRIPEAKLIALTNVIYEIKHRSETV